MAKVLGEEPCFVARLTALALALFAVLWTVTARAGQGGTRAQNAAQAQIVAALFPDPQRVVADYSDDPSRYAALTLLYFTVQKATLAPRPVAVDQKITAYFRAAGEVDLKHTRQGFKSKAYMDYEHRWRQLVSDPSFRQGVMAKYGLTNLPGPNPQAAAGGGGWIPKSGDARTDLVNLALLRGAPFWIATLLVMAVLPAPMLLIAGQLSSSSSFGAGGNNSPVQLPESLRVIKVLGKHYPVEVESGKVLEEKVWSETHVSTSTSGGQTYVQGNQVYTTPVQVHTHSSVTTQNRVWVRGADGRENAWTYTGEAFKTRQGHVISRIVRRLRNGDMDLVLLCNHSTGECATRHDGYRAAHRVSKFLPWLVTTGLGTVGYVMGIATVYRALAPTGIRPTGSPSDQWIVGFIGSAIAALILVGITAAVIRGARNRKVQRQYIPAFIQFLGQSTPTLAKRFAAL